MATSAREMSAKVMGKSSRSRFLLSRAIVGEALSFVFIKGALDDLAASSDGASLSSSTTCFSAEKKRGKLWVNAGRVRATAVVEARSMLVVKNMMGVRIVMVVVDNTR